MEHSKNFEKVKKFYKMGIWSEKMVWNAVGKWITPEEYKEITGEDYSKEGSDYERMDLYCNRSSG